MGQGKNTGQVSLVPRFIQPMTSLPSLCLSKIEKSTWSTSSLILDIALPLRSNARSPVITNFNFSSINIHISTHLYSLKINSQTEDTQVGYISQKYTLEKYSLGKCTVKIHFGQIQMRKLLHPPCGCWETTFVLFGALAVSALFLRESFYTSSKI